MFPYSKAKLNPLQTSSYEKEDDDDDDTSLEWDDDGGIIWMDALEH